MTQLESITLRPSHIPVIEKAIPMTFRRIGSWEVLISRRPLSMADLASRYDAVSGSWEQTARRFQLDAAYQKPLLASEVALYLTRIGPQARILDCGVGVCGGERREPDTNHCIVCRYSRLSFSIFYSFLRVLAT